MGNPIGVINEQGFAAGDGLGFNPLNEADAKKVNDDNKDSEPKK